MIIGGFPLLENSTRIETRAGPSRERPTIQLINKSQLRVVSEESPKK